MKKTLYLFLFFVLPFFCYSQKQNDFIYVTSSNKGHEFYVFIEKSEDYIKEFWLKKVNPIKKYKNKKGKIIISGGYTVEFITLNCLSKEYNSTDAVYYYSNGNTDERPKYDDEYEKKIIPGTVMYGIYEYVCDK